MDDLELTYEHIDWVDIADAELSGDQQAIQQLMDRSLELRRTNSQPAAPTRLPFEDFLNTSQDTTKEQNDVQTTPTVQKPAPMRSNSYAEVARSNKRTLAQRVGVSPLDVSTKRSAIFISPPPKHTMLQTPANQILGSPSAHSPMETSTPESDRPLKVAAQRRLFAAGKENEAHPNSDGLTDQLTVHRLSQRQKQIDYGKNTIGYTRYIQIVPKWKRSKTDPRTPDKNKSCSTRSWQGQIRAWRRALHKWDPVDQALTAEEAALCGMEVHLDEY